MRIRVLVLAIAGSLMLGACSGSEGSTPSTVPTIELVPIQSTIPIVTAPADDGGPTTSSVEPDRFPGDAIVDVTVATEIPGIAGELSGPPVGPADDEGPFGVYASCSGYRATVSTYSVVISAPGSDVEAVSLLTTEPIAEAPPGQGLYEAELHIEPAVGSNVDASGILTLDGDLRSGSFQGATAAGESIDVGFECFGGNAEPAPLIVGDAPGELETIEVFVLLRRGQRERFVGLAVDTRDAADSVASCSTDEALVSIEGDFTAGAISSFVLTDGIDSMVRLQVGGVSYLIEQPEIGTTDEPMSGSFHAVGDDGLTIDGAYRCT